MHLPLYAARRAPALLARRAPRAARARAPARGRTLAHEVLDRAHHARQAAAVPPRWADRSSGPGASILRPLPVKFVRERPRSKKASGGSRSRVLSMAWGIQWANLNIRQKLKSS